ncbi:hypothetical protein [Asticcacaulis endophyticus]|uniref:Uncharacterized protein n=1 Tax=Asticcacaulis endophyticus TaxID=1395890 RepID=A0A918QBQ5_9CAUL|nr:hypothetical protein [Asticcacaulis endophyticus]GGZ39029.1 hypothetical protein GCM10011273_26760 [Asticcacaulis endophyticus]
MADFSDLNVFQMYVANGEQPGFWLKRTTWDNTVAQVTSVGPFTAAAPYYGNPEVCADIYELSSGALKELGAKIPVPGTYKTWRQIDPPRWAK